MSHRNYSRGRGSSRTPPERWTSRSQSDTKTLKNEIKNIVHKLKVGRDNLIWYETKYMHTQSAATARREFGNVHYCRGELRLALIRYNQLLVDDPYLAIGDYWLHINTDQLRRCLFEFLPKYALLDELNISFQGLKWLWDRTEGLHVDYDEPHIRFPRELAQQQVDPLPDHYWSH